MSLTQRQKDILNKYISLEKDKDALRIYPFRYENLEVQPFKSWQEGQQVLFSATIISDFVTLRLGAKRSMTRFKLLLDEKDEKGQNLILSALFFNWPWIDRSLVQQRVTCIGVYHEKGLVVTSLSKKPLESLAGLRPIYPLKKGVKQQDLRAIMKKILKKEKESIVDPLPFWLVEKYRLLDLYQALSALHAPTSYKHLQAGLRSLKYREALAYQVTLEMEDRRVKKLSKQPRQFDSKKLETSLASLPFSLTHDQAQALKDILTDCQGPHIMKRLLLGDVGSGKTIVALLAAKVMIEAGFQVVFMAPTEILAKQHYQSAQLFFKDLDPVLIHSAMTKTEREAINQNEPNLLIGTHVLFSDDFIYPRLGLIIIDEQQRFGVKQRQSLLAKGPRSDVLMLSATPIPRTLAASLYRHLDLSLIQEVPNSGKTIHTQLVLKNSMGPILDDLIDKLDQGQQAYVVCAGIDEGGLADIKTVTSIARHLKNYFKDRFKVDLVHGQLATQTIDSRLEAFREKKTDILVCTTLIEVGIHVEKANLMVIYDADRFGLSQLHQLRGRIGRGSDQGYCYLLTKSKDPKALERLTLFCQESSGFKLSQIDLQLRGSGDLLGFRQSGIPLFTIFNPIQDQAIGRQVQVDAPLLLQSAHPQDVAYCEGLVHREKT